MQHVPIERPNLEQLKKQAKDLLKLWQNQDPSATARMAKFGFDNREPRLHLTQLTLARELGFLSWTQLKQWVGSFVSNMAEASERICQLALVDSVQTRREERLNTLLQQFPDLSKQSIYLGALLGDVETVNHALSRQPDVINQKGGPANREPLLYACFSWFLKFDESRKPAIRAVIQRLLAAGADPNAAYDYDNAPLSALYGVSGVCFDPEATQLLLDAGANVNDGETFYHASEEPGCRCLERVMSHGGASKESLTYAIFRKMDFEDIPGARVILAGGGDPNAVWEPSGASPLMHAILRQRSAETIQVLLEAGANPNFKDPKGDSPFAMAMRLGRTDIAQLLTDKGADTTLSPVDQLLADCAQGKRPDDLAAARALMAQAQTHHIFGMSDWLEKASVEAMETLLDCGFPIDGGEPPDDKGRVQPTLLHWACWKGRVDLVEALLKRDAAAVNQKERWYDSEPLGWTCHGSFHSRASSPDDYAACARLLLTHGAHAPSLKQEWWQYPESASPEVQTVLAEFATE